MGNILVIDTDEKFCNELARAAERLGHNVTFVNTFLAGFTQLRTETHDAVVLNSHMPDGSGIDAILSIKQFPAAPEILVITDANEPDEAALAITHSVWDFVPRPAKAKLLLPLIVNVLLHVGKKSAEESRTNIREKDFEGLVGASVPWKACLERIGAAAKNNEAVLVQGEPGTGKKLVASAIHKNSLRAEKNFVVLECAALKGKQDIPHELIEKAQGGTLVLDEVCELPPAVQRWLVRALRERRSTAPESNERTEQSFRLIACTGRNLGDMVHQKKFNEDLFLRIHSCIIELPALRQRREDMKSIVGYHLPKICERLNVETKKLSPEFTEALRKYEWPGNVRELVDALKHSVVKARSETLLLPQHLPMHVRVHLAKTSVSDANARRNAKSILPRTLPAFQAMREAVIEKAEREYLRELKAIAGKDIQKASAIAQISPSRLYTLLRKYKNS